MRIIENNLEDVLYPEAALKIVEMGVLDQDYRAKLSDGTAEWDDALDLKNSQKLKGIVSEIGWPTISKVGLEANNYAWLIIQHSSDLEFQRSALQAMKKAAESKDNPLSQIAYLEDRTMCITSNQQMYGTQYQITPDGRSLPFKIVDPENVNARRSKMELPPIRKEFENPDYHGYEVKWGNKDSAREMQGLEIKSGIAIDARFAEQDLVGQAVKDIVQEKMEKYSVCIDVDFLDRANRPTSEVVKSRTVELNPGLNAEKIFVARTWDVENFESANLPVIVGELRDKEMFSAQRGMRILDLPIKMPGQGWKIPTELAQFREVIAMAVDQERIINPDFDDDYFAYIIVDQKVVEPGKNQRRAGYHSDAFITDQTEVEIDGDELARKVDRTYVAYDTVPTAFLPGPFPIDCDAEDCDAVLESFKKRAEGQIPIFYPAHTVLRLDPYDVHSSQTNETDQAVERTFIKISFSKSVYNRDGNDVNPHFNYNWTMVPRDPARREHRNHIIGAENIDREKFVVIDPKIVDFEKDEISWIENGVFLAKKIEGVRAEPAKTGEKLETKMNDFVMTVNTAREGFWKITTSKGDQYFLDEKQFRDNYKNEPDRNGIYPAKGVPRKMVKLSKAVCFVAPWGAMQYVPKGGVLVISDKYDIYGIHQSNFEASFERD